MVYVRFLQSWTAEPRATSRQAGAGNGRRQESSRIFLLSSVIFMDWKMSDMDGWGGHHHRIRQGSQSGDVYLSTNADDAAMGETLALRTEARARHDQLSGEAGDASTCWPLTCLMDASSEKPP
jgi:CheY-like chemotaxis protein